MARTLAKGRKERLALLQRMHAEWPFFGTLLSNMDMVLAKSDLALATRYVDLVPDKRAAKKIFAAIQAEWKRTNDALALITGQTKRLATNPSLARSIEHRLPYLDPLNHLQVELMRRYRAKAGAAEGDEAYARVRRGGAHVDQRRGGGPAQLGLRPGPGAERGRPPAARFIDGPGYLA